MSRKPECHPRWEVHQLRLLPFGGSELVARKPRKAARPARGGCDASCRLVEGELARFIGHWAGIPSAVLVADEVTRISREVFAELTRLGLLVPGGTARAVGCEACDQDHAEWVETVSGPDGDERFFIPCPQEGRVEVARSRVQQWQVDFAPLARAIKESLMAFGSMEPVHPGRLWRLGRASLAGRSRELWMARQVSAGRGPEPGSLIPRTGDPLVFLLGWPPEESILALGDEAVFNVSRVVHVRGAGFHVDRRAIERRMRSLRAGEEAAQTQLLCCCG